MGKKRKKYQQGGMLVDPNIFQLGSQIISSTTQIPDSSAINTGGSILSGGLQGAAIGSQIAPGIGTAIGAGLGALSSGISSIRDNNRRKRMEGLMKRQQMQRIQGQSRAVLSAFPSQGIEGGGNVFQEGGIIEGAVNVLDGASNIDLLADGMLMLEGNTHENNGISIDTNFDSFEDAEVEDGEVIDGDKVYSNRLAPTEDMLNFVKDSGFRIIKGDTYAKLASRLGKKLGDFQKMEILNSMALNTRDIMMDRIETLLDNLFLDQEISKNGITI